MREGLVAFVIFLCLVGASLGSLLIYARLHERYRHEETATVVRLVANIFVVMTSLVLGLMINSAKNTFEVIDGDVHSFATDAILLDRTLRQYGVETDEARRDLLVYMKRATNGVAPDVDQSHMADRTSESLLEQVGSDMRKLKPGDADHSALWLDAQQRFQKLVELRWILVEQSEGTIPTPLLVMMVGWLILIFASFGYQAPRNRVVIGSLVLAPALIAGTIYLILDMDSPLDGPIQVSPAPMLHAITEMEY